MPASPSTNPPSGASVQVRAVHVLITGFMQRRGARTGLSRVWRRLLPLNSPTDLVWAPRVWNDDWRGIADRIKYLANGAKPPAVYVYAYSWGAGYGAKRLAKLLADRGVPVAGMVLCDPVYRSRLPFLRWLAFVPGLKINMPATVDIENVHVFRQKRSRWLRGHQVLVGGLSPTHAEIELTASHGWADRSPAFLATCCEVATGVKLCEVEAPA